MTMQLNNCTFREANVDRRAFLFSFFWLYQLEKEKTLIRLKWTMKCMTLSSIKLSMNELIMNLSHLHDTEIQFPIHLWRQMPFDDCQKRTASRRLLHYRKWIEKRAYNKQVSNVIGDPLRTTSICFRNSRKTLFFEKNAIEFLRKRWAKPTQNVEKNVYIIFTIVCTVKFNQKIFQNGLRLREHLSFSLAYRTLSV